MSAKLLDLIESLTYEHAQEYMIQQDPLCWIEYTLLDPNNIPRHYAEEVESILINIFEGE